MVQLVIRFLTNHTAVTVAHLSELIFREKNKNKTKTTTSKNGRARSRFNLGAPGNVVIGDKSSKGVPPAGRRLFGAGQHARSPLCITASLSKSLHDTSTLVSRNAAVRAKDQGASTRAPRHRR